MPSKRRRGFSTIVMGLFGFVIGSFLIALGLALTATIVGAVLGIPLILAGVGMWAVGPFMGWIVIQEKCPICETPLWFFGKQDGTTCDRCKHRIILRDGTPVSV